MLHPQNIVHGFEYAAICPCTRYNTYCMVGYPILCHMLDTNIVIQVCISCVMMPICVSHLRYIGCNTSVHIVRYDARQCVTLMVHTT